MSLYEIRPDIDIVAYDGDVSVLKGLNYENTNGLICLIDIYESEPGVWDEDRIPLFLGDQILVDKTSRSIIDVMPKEYFNKIFTFSTVDDMEDDEL